MKTHDPAYIPALNVRVLTPLYDPLSKWIMQEERFKRRLIEQAALQPGHHILDLGCGTGTLTIMLKQAMPGAQVVGLDGDPDVLAIARKKAEQAGVEIRFDTGLASDLLYKAETFDRVLSSLVIHHLTTADKEKAFKEVFRILKHGGEFHGADFGRPKALYARLVAHFVRHMERVDDNLKGLIPVFLMRAGFTNVSETVSFPTPFGTLTLLKACKE